MSTASGSSVWATRDNLRAQYKAIEVPALLSLLEPGENLFEWSSKYLLNYVTAKCSDLDAGVKTAAANALTRSNTIRRKAARTWPSDSEPARSHRHWIRIVVSIITLLQLPDNSIAEAEAVLEDTPSSSDDRCATAEFAVFAGEIEECMAMISRVWDEVIAGSKTMPEAHIASSCMTRYIISHINSTQLIYPEWFDEEYVKEEYLDQIVGEANINKDLWKRKYRGADHESEAWIDKMRVGFKLIPQFDGDPLFSSIRGPYPCIQLTRKASQSSFGVEWVVLEQLLVNMEPKTAQAREAIKWRRREVVAQLVEINKFTLIHKILTTDEYNAMLAGMMKTATTATMQQVDLWTLACISSWASAIIRVLSRQAISQPKLRLVAHIFEYNMLFQPSSPYVSSPEHFTTFCNKYASFLYFQGERPQTIEAWKISTGRFINFKNKEEFNTATKVFQTRVDMIADKRFTEQMLLSNFGAQGLLGTLNAPTQEWWNQLQAVVRTDLAEPTLVKCLDNVAAIGRETDWRAAVGLLQYMNTSTHRDHIKNILQQNPLDGNWLADLS
ncbi:hypothetical protein F5B20DRAFT_589530 [Whalleya microplaca]|nr:hypothetical protein F5B20DRAFT_589530 [Whalleya microplaca]